MLTVGISGSGVASVPPAVGPQAPDVLRARDVDVPLLPVKPLLLLAEPSLFVPLLEELERHLQNQKVSF